MFASPGAEAIQATFELSSYEVAEMGVSVEVCVLVSVTGQLQSPVPLTVFTSSGSAQGTYWLQFSLHRRVYCGIIIITENLDYTGLQVTLLFSSAGRQCVSIFINNDNSVEGDEQFLVVLTGPFALSATTTVTILDDVTGMSSCPSCLI